MREIHEINGVLSDGKNFELTARRLANSLVFGMDDSTFHGSGIEYAQPRPYVPGDSVKLMDWKVTGRTGKHYVKEYQETKRLPMYILLDTSASMCVSSEKKSKYAWALYIAAGLALSALGNMKPVGLLGCGEERLHLKPTLSEGQILQTAHRLRKHGFQEMTSFGKRLRELGPSLKTRTMIIALTDLHDPDAIKALSSLGQEHDCMVLHLQDKAEKGIKGSGLFRGQEAETGFRFIGHGRKNWDHSESCQQELLRAGVNYCLLPTDQPILPRLQFFLGKHGQGSGGAR